MNKFFRQKRLYVDRQRNKSHKQIIQHFINNSNYTNLFIKNFLLSKHQSAYSNKFNELKYLRSKIRKLKRSFQFNEHQFRFFFKNNRLNEIFRHYRKMKTILNSFHFFNFSRQNRYFQNYQ